MTATKNRVASHMIEARQPPFKEGGAVLWLRRNLFSSWLQSILTVISLVISLMFIESIVSFALIDAVFSGRSREDCLAHDGACWPYVYNFFHQFVYGNYPLDQRWRVDSVFFIGALGLVYLLAGASLRLKYAFVIYALAFVIYGVDAMIFDGESLASMAFIALIISMAVTSVLFNLLLAKQKMPLAILLMLVGYPCYALIMLNGGNFDLDGFSLGLEGIGLETGTFLFWIEYVLFAMCSSLLMMMLVRATGVLDARKFLTNMGFFWAGIGFVLLVLDTDFGLESVRTNYWGGLLVTLVIAVAGIAASLPLGVALALGRRSKMPVIRFFSIAFIEFWRGVPLITVLFMAKNMIPLFLPKGVVGIDGLLSVLIGVTMFSSAYMAEVIRGGLQAVPKGQYEGAMALGLSYGQMMRMIIMPQALKMVIPGIVNTFIGLFKDTTLVSIVGIADVLGTVQRSFSDPTWSTPTQAHTGYLVTSVIFFIFCFMMSRYSLYMERKLHTDHKR